MFNPFKPKMTVVIEIKDALTIPNAGEYVSSVINKIEQEYGSTHTLVVGIKIKA